MQQKRNCQVTIYNTNTIEPICIIEGLLSIIVSTNELTVFVLDNGDRELRHIFGLDNQTTYMVTQRDGIGGAYSMCTYFNKKGGK